MSENFSYIQNNSSESYLCVGGSHVVSRNGVAKINSSVCSAYSNGKRFCGICKVFFKEEMILKNFGYTSSSDKEGNPVKWQKILHEFSDESFKEKKMFSFEKDFGFGSFIGFLGNRVCFSGKNQHYMPIIENLDGNVKWKQNEILPPTKKDFQFIIPLPGCSGKKALFHGSSFFVYDEEKEDFDIDNPIKLEDDSGEDVIFENFFSRKMDIKKCGERVFGSLNSVLYEFYFKKDGEPEMKKPKKIEKDRVLIRDKVFKFLSSKFWLLDFISCGKIGLLCSFSKGFNGLGKNLIYTTKEEFIDLGIKETIFAVCENSTLYIYKKDNKFPSENQKPFLILTEYDINKMKRYKISTLFNPVELQQDMSYTQYEPLTKKDLVWISPKEKNWNSKAKTLYQVKSGKENQFKIFCGYNCKKQEKLKDFLTDDYFEVSDFGQFASFVGAPIFHPETYNPKRLSKGTNGGMHDDRRSSKSIKSFHWGKSSYGSSSLNQQSFEKGENWIGLVKYDPIHKEEKLPKINPNKLYREYKYPGFDKKKRNFHN